jgi:hypothetical protein
MRFTTIRTVSLSMESPLVLVSQCCWLAGLAGRPAV